LIYSKIFNKDEIMPLSDYKFENSIIRPKNSINSLDYHLVTYNEYCRDASNETHEHLEKLSDFSKTIEFPPILGTFKSEEHYLKTLKLVLASTHETRNRVLFFLNEILPLIPMESSLLDVGPGDGSLTKFLAPNFKQITAVDKNHIALTDLKKLLAPSINFLQIPKSILSVELPSDCYHLAVLSHILYYIEPELWLRIVKSAYKSLKQDGVLVIVMGGDEFGKAELIDYFGGQVLQIDQLAIDSCNTFGSDNVNLYVSNESFVSSSLEAMLHIAAFMLADADIRASKKELISYINQKLRFSKKHFELTTRQ
jgi:SAM-dependent methyltransferase